MFYLAIDLHHRQMTIYLRGENGEPILRRQVSTWGPDPQIFWPTCKVAQARRANVGTRGFSVKH